MLHPTVNQRNTRNRTVFALVCSAAVVAGSTHALARQASPPEPPSAASQAQQREYVRQLARIGLTSESLAAAGLDGPSAAMVISRFGAVCATLPMSLTAAENSRRAAERTHASLVAKALRTTWTTMTTDIATAAANVEASRQQEEGLLTLVFNTSVSDMTPELRSRLQTHRENLENRLPLALSMTPRSAAATKLLMAALAAESNKPADALDVELQSSLAAARSDANAVAIPLRLAAQGEEVRAAVRAAIASLPPA